MPVPEACLGSPKEETLIDLSETLKVAASTLNILPQIQDSFNSVRLFLECHQETSKASLPIILPYTEEKTSSPFHFCFAYSKETSYKGFALKEDYIRGPGSWAPSDLNLQN